VTVNPGLLIWLALAVAYGVSVLLLMRQERYGLACNEERSRSTVLVFRLAPTEGLSPRRGRSCPTGPYQTLNASAPQIPSRNQRPTEKPNRTKFGVSPIFALIHSVWTLAATTTDSQHSG